MAGYKRARQGRALFRASVAIASIVAGTAAHADEAADAPDSITVTGQRLSTVAAIEEKKKADNVIDIISADNLGKLPDANVADALARIPGLSVIVNQDTGEGEYVAIRGLSGTYNAVYINGVRVAQTDPGSRDVSLTVLPPNGLASIRVTKTLTPDQDGDGIGGSIDFRTPTAFDFQNDLTLRAYGAAGFNQQAKDAGEAAGTYQGQLDFGKRFADGRFGVFISANYGMNHGNGQETENDGEWEPYRWRKDSQEAIDQSNMHLPGIDLDYRRLQQKRYGGNVSFDYHGDHTQLYLRGQYSHQEQRGTNDVTDYRSRKTARLTQVNINDTTLVQPDKAVIGTGAKGRIYSYTTSQIVDADGDGVITDADRNSSQYWSLNGRSGVWNPQAFQFARNFSTIDQNQTLYTIDLGGHIDAGRLQLDYDASYSGGSRATPESYSISYNCDKCTYPLNAQGLDWVSADPRFPHVDLTGPAANVEHDSSLLPFDGLNVSRDRQKDSRIAFRFDARYNFEGSVLDYVKVGAKFLQSKRQYDYYPGYGGDLSGTPLDGLNLKQSGLVQKEVMSVLGGQYYYGDVFNRDKVVAAINAAMKANGFTDSGSPDLTQRKRGTERVYAAYALAHFHFDSLQVIAGTRFERRETHNVGWSDDSAGSGFIATDRGYNVLLPSVTAIWRPDDKNVVRAAIWTGYSPPEYGFIAASQSVSRNSKGEVVGISRGNPDLKAARALNLDLSLETYPDATSIVSAGVYYKRISNFIFTGGNEVNANTSVGTVVIDQPQNGQRATIYGVELNIIKGLQGITPPFDGFGIEGNITVQKSSAETGLAYRAGKPIRFVNTPHLIYNAALTYQKYGVEAKLSYNYRGKYIESLRDNAVDKWVQPNRSLDFHSRYNFNKHFALDFDVGNILGGWKYYTTKGDNPSYQKDYMEPGRTFLFRASYVY
ncbi:TonB-dependent receptor [Novosphingobium sp. MD-1]|uniref:TonB-dependent receptor n=1 Tax=Novosphingobium sp. MD-1 TaxID=1630648 RepID=UPI00061C0A41|nr:TonB-dependent receptor [Novosphingobium sp. MD-1]GAO53076.1 tonB-dependent receptor [Novosphingobium sp. MD-1]